ncbi:unnamed protein product [Adineta steineri]|uniref:Uncharacterized protein n=1 Tax=Adineta steineri TaxID=433720 RepID=A0A814NWN9_9BILA|nr:unnamed protein product [Adineta steineri]CAF1099500.1 unnamed protein product [Adineta steineri]CAF3823702.1 unnamed protein product [Adineta steineri]
MGCCGSKNKVVPPAKSNAYSTITPATARDDKPTANNPPPPPQQDNSAMQRFNKVALSTTNPLPLVNGYGDEPVGTLEEALQPVDGRIDNAAHYIQDAKAKCHFPSEHGLTRDESAAIYIYSKKWNNRYVSDQLQQAFSTQNRSQLQPWYKYLRLLKSGLDKLPATTTGIWQGMPFDDRLNEKLSSNSTVLYTCLGSCAPTDSELKSYLQKNYGPKTILLSYESVNGKAITNYTASKSPEIMIWPGTKMGVSKYAVVDSNGSVVAHLLKKNDPPKQVTIKKPPSEKHFVCPTNCCGNRCRGNHKPEHCYGFSNLVHNCHHHCGPVNACFRCGNDCCDLRECNKCQGRYCEKCSLQ